MTTLAEIELAADRLPRPEQEVLLKRLQAKLLPSLPAKTEHRTAMPEPIVWPDYEARLQAVYGSAPMPSMVLTEREAASW